VDGACREPTLHQLLMGRALPGALDALETLAQDLPDSIDLVLLDGHKPLYPRILELLEPRLLPGACLVADNADASPDYLARVRAVSGGYHSLPFASDVELSIKL
jgi:predicted O-methyltransferase YrrM